MNQVIILIGDHVSLRLKILLVVLVTVVGLMLILFLVSNGILMSSFTHLEEIQIAERVNGAQGVLTDEETRLLGAVTNWSARDEMYQYTVGENPGFPETALVGESFAQLKINLLMIYDSRGRRLYSGGFDLQDNRRTEAPEKIIQQLESYATLISPANMEEGTSGLVLLPVGAMLVASHPILSSAIDGPPQGTLVFGQYLSVADFTQHLKNPLISFDLAGSNEVNLSTDFVQARDSFSPGQPVMVLPLSSRRVAGYIQKNDLGGKPVMLRFEYPREIYSQGMATISYLVGSLLVAGAIVWIVLMIVMQRFILSRLEKLSADVTSIAEKGDLSGRVEVTGSDELSGLAVKINQALQSIEHTDQKLRESEERYTLASMGAKDGLWDWNLLTNAVYYSPRWKGMLGLDDSQVKPELEGWMQRIHPEDETRVRTQISAHLEDITPDLEVEYRILHGDGEYRWMLARGLAVRDARGAPYRMAGSQTDITVRKKAEEQLIRHAFYDTLTGLPNRLLLVDRLGRTLERLHRDAQVVCAVMILDIDRFKLINDSLGHQAGDELLCAFVRRLETTMRAIDTIAHMQGDEFAILLEGVNDPAEVLRIASRLGEAVKPAFQLGTREIFLTVSIGVVLVNSSYIKAEDLLRDAEIAMYRAKSIANTDIQIYDPTWHSHTIERLELENELRLAQERGEFELHYQPIYLLTDGVMQGFEALIRWRNPQRGMVMPGSFIAVAEETGLIIDIGRWVLMQACRQLAEWQQRFPMSADMTINVNISGKQFTHKGLYDHVLAALRSSGIRVNSLRLEITENVFMENAKSALETLNKLNKLGVQLQIDDFGTGYSSLSSLRSFPINTIKIDRSFISQMGEEGKEADIVRNVVTLARDLGLRTVAEGVETIGQLDQLQQLGCEYAQGYYFSRPVDAVSIEEMLRKVVYR